MDYKRVLSGVQPTGSVHIGNWLGAIRNWVELQNKYETFVCVVDLHALTNQQNIKDLKENTLSTAAIYLACGIDPEKCAVFIQSHISAHSELCWILNCVTPLNWLERMIQYKEKSIKQGENVSLGLLDYPILMAADILLYDADLVPVGEDQKQHLELARDIAQQRINAQYGRKGSQLLKIPQPLILSEGAKIMSLSNGRCKMSKSDQNENSRICLLDSSDLITKKIKKAKTDSEIGLEYGNSSRPEADNLLRLYAILSNQTKENALNECQNMGWGKFKVLLTDATISSLEPIQKKYKILMNERDEIISIVNKGRDKAEKVANKTLNRVCDAIGLMRKN